MKDIGRYGGEGATGNRCHEAKPHRPEDRVCHISQTGDGTSTSSPSL